MPIWLLPPMPWMSKFYFSMMAIMLIFGTVMCIVERRKEIEKEKRQNAISFDD